MHEDSAMKGILDQLKEFQNLVATSRKQFKIYIEAAKKTLEEWKSWLIKKGILFIEG